MHRRYGLRQHQGMERVVGELWFLAGDAFGVMGCMAARTSPHTVRLPHFWRASACAVISRTGLIVLPRKPTMKCLYGRCTIGTTDRQHTPSCAASPHPCCRQDCFILKGHWLWYSGLSLFPKSIPNDTESSLGAGKLRRAAVTPKRLRRMTLCRGATVECGGSTPLFNGQA